MTMIWCHMRKLWPRYTLLPGLPLTLWCVLMAALGMLRWDQVAVAAIVIVVAYGSETTKRFFVAFGAFAGIAWFYDATRFFRDLGVTVDRVALCGLHNLEASLFGTVSEGKPLTLQDYFFVHHHPAADLYFAIPYGIFIYVSMGYGIYLFFKDYRACQRYSWAFFALNVVGFITYHVLPAAPPWYYHRCGCLVDLAAPASEGEALARVDAMLGMSYFHGFYGRSAEVFGAIPSLHVSYPLLIILEGWHNHRFFGRVLAVVYFASMCAAAVYLDHHWVIDVVLGWMYALVTFLVFRKLIPVRASAESLMQLEPSPARLSDPNLVSPESVR